MSQGRIGRSVLDLGSNALNSAFKNPEGAGQVFRGLRNSLGPEQFDEFVGALLQQGKNLVQPKQNPIIRGLRDTAVLSIPAGLGVAGTYLALGGPNKNNDGTGAPGLDNSSEIQPPQQDLSVNTNTNPAPFTPGLVDDPTSLDDFYKGLLGLAQDNANRADYLISSEYLDDAQNRARDAKLAINKQVLESIEGRTRENSRRQESISRINAWKTIEQETIRANKDIALGLASVAYQSGIPNAGTLSALSPVVQAGASSFAPGASVLGSVRR